MLRKHVKLIKMLPKLLLANNGPQCSEACVDGLFYNEGHSLVIPNHLW